MRYKDREGNLKGENGFQDKLLKSLYGSTVGRVIVKCLTVPFVSKLGGKFWTVLCRECLFLLL